VRINVHLGERIEQHVEQRELRGLEANAVTAPLTNGQQRTQLVQRLLRQEAHLPVAELEQVGALLHRGQQLRQRHLVLAVAHRTLEVEPIDSRAHPHLQPARRHIAVAVGLHGPSLTHERGEQARQREHRHRHGHAPVGKRIQLLCAERLELGDGVALRGLPAAVEGARAAIETGGGCG